MNATWPLDREGKCVLREETSERIWERNSPYDRWRPVEASMRTVVVVEKVLGDCWRIERA